MALSWCQSSYNQSSICDQGINVEAAENVFKCSMKKIETGRRTRGGIQLQKSLMIAMIALKARRYIWEEHMQCYMALRQPSTVQSNSSSIVIDSSLHIDSPNEIETESKDNTVVSQEIVEIDSKISTEMELNRKRPSSTSDSDSDSDDDLDSVFLSPASPHKRSRRDQLLEIDEISDDDSNSDDSFTSPVINQLVTSFDNLLADADHLNNEFCSDNHDDGDCLHSDMSYIPLSCSLTVTNSMSSSSYSSQSHLNACVS